MKDKIFYGRLVLVGLFLLVYSASQIGLFDSGGALAVLNFMAP